jgi:hypothetical protein
MENQELLEYACRLMNDLVSDFMYYNRKHDEEFTVAMAEQLMDTPGAVGALTEAFRIALLKAGTHD